MSHRLNERGQGLVEYVLAVVLMALLAIGAIKFLGQKTHNAFVQAGTDVQDQMNYTTSNGNKNTNI